MQCAVVVATKKLQSRQVVLLTLGVGAVRCRAEAEWTTARKQWMNGIKALVRTKRNRSKDPEDVEVYQTGTARLGDRGSVAMVDGLRRGMSEMGGMVAVRSMTTSGVSLDRE